MRQGATVIVVGGGPAGLMAAGSAAVSGAQVLLLEKMDRVGLKLGLTGKGRCNLTNIEPVREMLSHYGSSGRFLQPALGGFCNRTLVSFFADLGVDTVVERGGRVFPSRLRAVGIVRALSRWASRSGVRIIKKSSVDRLLEEKGKVIGVWAGDRFYRSDCVILATGGLSYPRTGSTGDGYRLAARVGHTIETPRASLVPLETRPGCWSRSIPGLALKNVRVDFLVEGNKQASQFGEMLFTHTGISGPIILTLSGQIVAALDQGRKVSLLIDLKPALDEKKLDNRLLRLFDAQGKRQASTLLKDLLPKRLISPCLAETKIPPDKRGDQITRRERLALRSWLKGVIVEPICPRPIDEAIITAGGISLKEVDPQTLSSRLVKGLYFAGEVLDIDADTGGYNLQAAFSTGYLAGQSVGESHPD